MLTGALMAEGQCLNHAILIQRSDLLLRILRFVFAMLGVTFAAYGLITNDFQFQSYMMLFLGLMFLVMSIEEFSEERKAYGWLFLATSLFVLFVAGKGFLLS